MHFRADTQCVASYGFGLLTLLVVALIGCDEKKGSSEPVAVPTDGEQLRFAVAQVDDTSGEPVPGSVSYPFFGASKLPEGTRIEKKHGYLAVVHPSKKVLRAFLADKVPAERWMAFQKVPGSDPDKPDWQAIYLHRKPVLGEMHVARVETAVDEAHGRPYVYLELTDHGRDLFADFTRGSAGQRAAILVGGEVQTVPVIREEIPGGKLRIDVGSDLNHKEALREADHLTRVIRVAANQ